MPIGARFGCGDRGVVERRNAGRSHELDTARFGAVANGDEYDRTGLRLYCQGTRGIRSPDAMFEARRSHFGNAVNRTLYLTQPLDIGAVQHTICVIPRACDHASAWRHHTSVVR